MLCMCPVKANPCPSCVYGRLVRSAASMAALTFSLASSETKWVPFISVDQLRKKGNFLHRTGPCEMCSFCPWQHTRHLRSLLHLLHPQLFPQQRATRCPGQPEGDSVESQANTGSAWQTSHLCVCMGTSGIPKLAGPSVCPPVCLRACTHCWCILVLSWHQSFHSYTGTHFIYKINHYNTKAKQAKCCITITTPLYDY